MSETGIVRSIDGLGRLSIPVQLRRKLGIASGDAVEFFVDGDDKIVLKRYFSKCAFCGNTECLPFKNSNICIDCGQIIAETPPTQEDLLAISG